jgi:enoyl-CoA hydratase
MSSIEGEIKAGVVGASAVVELNRPAARNALSQAMLAPLPELLKRWAKDPQVYALVLRSAVDGVFSVGGDVRELAARAREDLPGARAALGREYALNWQIDCFSKPAVSLIDGAIMGSGVGLTLHGTHRVAGPRYRFAMPETAIGFFPDVGVAHHLARMPDHIGLYLGLTGRSIDQADAYALGLCTHCIEASAFPGIARALSEADPVDALLDGLHRDPGDGTLTVARRATIREAFGAGSVAEIIARLEKSVGDEEGFAREIAADLASRSPVALAVTHRVIQRARRLDLRQTLIQDYCVGTRFLETPDFGEGVRALLVDKDRKPKWQPPDLAGVFDLMVDNFFAAPPGGDLALPSREEMQSRRG